LGAIGCNELWQARITEAFMRLNLYRRHRGKCEAGRGRNFMSSELDERRKD